MVSRILRLCMVLLIIFTVVEEAAARTRRIYVYPRGHVRVQRSPTFAIGIGGFSAPRVLRSRGGGGTRITNIDRSRHVDRSRNTTVNRAAQVDDATSDDDNSDDDDSGNDDSDSDGDAGGSDDGGDD